MIEVQEAIPGLSVEPRQPSPEAKFPLGEVEVEPEVRCAVPAGGPGSVAELLRRHECGDHGILGPGESGAEGDFEGRIYSAFVQPGEEPAIVEIVTAADQSHTNVRLDTDAVSYWFSFAE